MAEDTSLISEYIDRASIKADTDFFLQNLNAILSGIRQVNSNKVSLDSANTFRTAAEGANALRQSTVQLVDAQGKLISTANGVATGTDKTTAAATKQKDALAALNAEYKTALRNSANMAIQFGEQSKEALDAADSAQKLKEKLDAATNIAKGKTTVNQTTNNTANTTANASSGDVSLTTNLDAIAQEQQRVAAATGVVVGELEKQQLDGILAANEWASAQKGAGKAALDTVDSVTELAGVFENIQTPLQNYTGTLSANIQQSQSYKDRLKEIADQIKLLNTSSPDYSARLASLTQEQAQIKIAASDLNQTINAQVKYLNAAEGSTDQLAQKLGIMRDVERSLSQEEKTSSFGQQLIKDIQVLDTVVKQSEANVGNFQRNVGNYANSLAPLFDKIGAELAKLKTQQQGLQDFSQRDPVGFKIGGAEQLNQVTASIQKLEQVQQLGFKTTNNYAQQINTLDRAFVDLAKSGTQSEDFLNGFQQSLQQAKGNLNASGTTFAGAFKVLENELGTVRQKLNDPALSGSQLKALENEEKLLTQLTSNLSQVFTTSRQELLAYTEASVQLGARFGEDSSLVETFQTQVGNAERKIKDLKKVMQFQSSDVPFLTGSIAAVNGLAGAFGAAQGAAQLLGDGSDDLQKAMVKLQALLTIITGLQALDNALQTRSGAIHTILAARIGLVNAAKSIQAKLFAQTAVAAQGEATALTESAAAGEANAAAQTQTAVAVEAAAVAQGEAAVAGQANAVAQTETAVAAGAATVAMGEEAVAAEGLAVAEGTAAAAATGLTTALAVGIGGAIVAVVAALVVAVKAVNDYFGRMGLALERLNKFNDAIKDGNALLVEQANLFSASQEGNKKYLEAQLSAAQAAGASQTKQFAIRKAIAQEEKNLAEANLQTLNVSRRQETVMLDSIQKLQRTKQGFVDDLAKAEAAGNKNDAEAATKNIEGTEKKIQSIKPLYDAVISARQRTTQANQAQNQVDIEQAKFEADERRKLILESVQIETDATKAKNDLILNSDRTTMAQRLKALVDNAAQEKKLIRAQTADVFADPSTEGTAARPLALKRQAEEIKKINQDAAKAAFDITFNERVREVTAATDTAKQRVQIEIDTNKEIASNQIFTLNQRLQAQATYNADQKKLLDDNLKLQLTQAGFSDEEIKTFEKTGKAEIVGKKVTAAELLDIQTQYETSVLKLAIDNGEQVNNIVKSDLQKQNTLFHDSINDIQRIYSGIDLSVNIDYSKEIIALNESLKKRQVTEIQYAQKRKDIEFKFQQETTQNLINSLQKRLNLYSDVYKEELAATVRVENLRQMAAKATTATEREELRKRIEYAQLELDIAKKNTDEYIALADAIAKANAALNTNATTKGTDDQQTKLDKVAFWVGKIQELDQQLTAFGDALFDHRLQQINAEQTAMEARYNREIDIINQTMANGIGKEKAIAEAEARHAAQKNQLDQKEKQEQQKKARFDKQQAIMNIILQTAVAVITNFVKNPALAVAAGVLGAAELAAAIAAPLPQYKEGKNVQDAPKAKDRYEGHAVVGDGGKSELIIREDGRMEVTPAQSTITYLKSRDIVLPDAKKALAQMHDVTTNMDNRVSNISHNTTIRSYQTAQRYEATKSGDVHFEKFNDTLSKGLKSLEQTIKNKKENHIHFADRGKTLVHSGGNIWEQLNR